MIRSILISTAVLALAATGAANAATVADSIKVTVSGKTEAAIKAELATAAKTVCSEELRVDNFAACVQDSYQQALDRFEKLKSAKLAAQTF